MASTTKTRPVRALEVRERKRKRIRRARLGRAGTLTLATVLSLAAAGLFAADQLFRPDAFAVEELSISGIFRHVDPVQVEEKVTHLVTGNFFAVDLETVEAAAESIAWVRDARVRRDWPRGVAIVVEEHIPVMRWGEDRWVTVDGEIITVPGAVALKEPVVLRGPEDSVDMMLARAREWEQELAAIDLRLTRVDLTSWYAWKLVVRQERDPIAHEFEVMLGRENTLERMSRFTSVYRKHLVREETRLKRVDARYPNGLTVTRVEAETETESEKKA